MSSTPTAPGRLLSIDLLRGTVMLLMLLDHVRETFYLHHPVADPMDVVQIDPALYLSRMLAHLCAPVFVLLTGLSAWLYGSRQPEPRRAAAAFLFKRGLFLVVLELTLVNFAWTFQLPPQTLYLQVIWAIGLSMIALAGLLWLPRSLLTLLGVVLVAGHNLLDGVRVEGDGAVAVLWKILHQRDWIALGEGMRARTSYPLLPWIGVIALGYAMGPWYRGGVTGAERQRRLLLTGSVLLGGFVLLRGLNVYGDRPWQAFDTPLRGALSFFNVTKYPPSLLFLLLTLGIALLLLRVLEWPFLQRQRWLALFGAAPMFFYLLHLYVLKLLQVGAQGLWGANHGDSYGLDSTPALWLCALLLALALYWPVRAFAQFKARRRDLPWLRYL